MTPKKHHAKMWGPLSTCCQNLEKNWGHWENLGESGRQTFNPKQAGLFRI